MSEAVLSARELMLNSKLSETTVEALGGRLRLVEMTCQEEDALRRFCRERRKALGRNLTQIESAGAYLLWAIKDEAGNRVLKDEDLDVIGTLPARDVRKLTDAVLKLNGLVEDEPTVPTADEAA